MIFRLFHLLLLLKKDTRIHWKRSHLSHLLHMKHRFAANALASHRLLRISFLLFLKLSLPSLSSYDNILYSDVRTPVRNRKRRLATFAASAKILKHFKIVTYHVYILEGLNDIAH